jgi:inactivated superfamily I helicase
MTTDLAALTEAELLRTLSRFEDRAATILAERGLASTDENDKRILRSNYMLARNRADVFMQMAMDAGNG